MHFLWLNATRKMFTFLLLERRKKCRFHTLTPETVDQLLRLKMVDAKAEHAAATFDYSLASKFHFVRRFHFFLYHFIKFIPLHCICNCTPSAKSINGTFASKLNVISSGIWPNFRNSTQFQKLLLLSLSSSLAVVPRAAQTHYMRFAIFIWIHLVFFAGP